MLRLMVAETGAGAVAGRALAPWPAECHETMPTTPATAAAVSAVPQIARKRSFPSRLGLPVEVVWSIALFMAASFPLRGSCPRAASVSRRAPMPPSQDHGIFAQGKSDALALPQHAG